MINLVEKSAALPDLKEAVIYETLLCNFQENEGN